MVFVATLVRVQATSTALAEFPFQFREGFLWVEVAVPQPEEPLNFLVDTGASVNVTNSRVCRRVFTRKPYIRAKPDCLAMDGNGLLSRFSSVTIDGKAGRLFLQERRSPL